MKRSAQWAETISVVTNPGLVMVVSLALITSFYAESTGQFWRWLGVSTALLVVPGLIYSAVTWQHEGKIDFDMTRREDRVVPLLLACLGAFIGSYFVSTRLDNPDLLLLSNTLVAMLVSLTIITTVWKISLHTSTLSALVTLLVIFRGPTFAWLYLAVLPVAWARLELKKHTQPQVVVGAIVGLIVTAVAALLFRS